MSSAPTTRAGEGEAAAGERRAADDDGEDRVELEPQAGVVAVGAVDVRADHQAGDAGAERRRTRTRAMIRSRERMPARRLASALPPTDSMSMPSAVRAGEQRRSRRTRRPRRRARTAASASSRRRCSSYGVLLIVMIWPVGDQLGEAAAGDHQDQRRDDRLDADDRRPASRSRAPSSQRQPERQRRARRARRRRCSGRRWSLMQQAGESRRRSRRRRRPRGRCRRWR